MKNFLSDPESEGITCYYLYHHRLVSHRRESPDLTLARNVALSLLKGTNRRTDESNIAFDAAVAECQLIGYRAEMMMSGNHFHWSGSQAGHRSQLKVLT